MIALLPPAVFLSRTSSRRGMSGRMSPVAEVEMQLVWLPARQETSGAGLPGW